MLADDDAADPYVRALGTLMARLGYAAAPGEARSILARMKDRLPEALRAVRTGT